MRVRLLALAAAIVIAGCNTDTSTSCCSLGGTPSLRVVNGFPGPVDIFIDDVIAASAVAPGAIDTLGPEPGSHTLVMRPTGGSTRITQQFATASGALATIAAVRSSTGAISAAVLDDTNEVVPAGATKLRVIHLAPNAGTLQVYRTQPDYQTPIAWQFPFNYQDNPTSLSAPFLQSTVGTWEVRIWQTPADSTGWATAAVKVQVPLTSGEKRTILILDAVGGGVRVQVI